MVTKRRLPVGDLDLVSAIAYADVCPGTCWTVDKLCRNVLPASVRTTNEVAHGSYTCPACTTHWMKSWEIEE
jgi:hypothetical protein